MNNDDTKQKMIIFIIMLFVFIIINAILAVIVHVAWAKYVLISVDIMLGAMLIYIINWTIKLSKK